MCHGRCFFQDDDRVVDQARQRQGQAAQNHRVDRAAAELQRSDEGGEQSERGIERNTASVARTFPRKMRIMRPVSTRPIGALVDQVVDRGLDEDGLVEDDIRDERFGHVEQVRDGLP